MTLRTRLLWSFAAVAIVPLSLLAFGVRQEMTARLSDLHHTRLETVVDVVHEDLQRESASIAARLMSLKGAILKDNRFRSGAVAGLESDATYVRDYAETAMRLTGLSMLQIQDDEGRIVSSGHFRNEHGRVEQDAVSALRESPDGIALLSARAPDRSFLALARGESLGIGGRMFSIVGGVAVDQAFLRRLARDREIQVSLRYPGGALSSDPGPLVAGNESTEAADAEIPVRLFRYAGDGTLERVPARLVVAQPLTLRELLRGVDALFFATAAGAVAVALLLAAWVSGRISRPLAALAEKTAVLDLDRLDVQFDDGTDEVGTLSRLLGDLAARLRTSTAHVREAERRATVGDISRQINHDIKNGLIPLRNVMRHLSQVAREEPSVLADVLMERRQTIDSSISYLETLATNYERLSPAADRRQCDLNALVAEVVRGARGDDQVEWQTRLSPELPRVVGDPVALRRIVENLTANAVESLEGRPGRVTVTTERIAREGEPAMIRLTVADTGRGIPEDERARIFTDFYTTKARGTGLGLSIVRRLVMDLQGTVRVESEPGAGTRMIVEIMGS